MEILKLLLSADKSKLEQPTRKMEIKRLSEYVGDKFICEIKGISINDFAELQEEHSENTVDFKLHMILKSVVSPNLKDTELLKYYDCKTPKQLLEKLLLPTEMNQLYSSIATLSGSDVDYVEEVKN